METRVGHCKLDNIDEYVGRGPNGRHMGNTAIGERGWLGNPFTLDDYTRDESIELFAEQFTDRVESDEEFRDAVADLQGDTLGCWCRPLTEDEPACHAEIIAQMVEWLNGNTSLSGTGIPQGTDALDEEMRD